MNGVSQESEVSDRFNRGAYPAVAVSRYLFN
jgi:hypothetical protein